MYCSCAKGIVKAALQGDASHFKVRHLLTFIAFIILYAASKILT
jgi:hypothetical protein